MTIRLAGDRIAALNAYRDELNRGGLIPDTFRALTEIVADIDTIQALAARLGDYETYEGYPRHVPSPRGYGDTPTPALTVERSDALAALPSNAVIIDNDGTAWQKTREDPNPSEDVWYMTGNDERTTSYELETHHYGPFQIVHIPGQDTTT